MGRLYTGPYVYKDNKKILKLHFFLKNTESLEKRIIKANGRECVTFAESRKRYNFYEKNIYSKV